MEQRIITAKDNFIELDQWLVRNNCRKVLMVCDGSVQYIKAFNAHLKEIESKGTSIIQFRDFQPNPLYESVVEGVSWFRDKGCDSIIAVGGGSAMDVAKCIKLYSNMQGNGENGDYLSQDSVPNCIPFMAMPTTAGTGSEATRYAVIYFNGEKQSVTSESIIPETVLIYPAALTTLPPYQKKATMMDALCHALESFWSVNSTEASKACSHKAMRLVMKHMDGYLANTDEGNEGMLRAAHIAGQAINITQTTAGHAMCYKITSLFQVAHGHAAILCNRVLFPWMIENTDRCIDKRGEQYLRTVYKQIATAMDCRDAGEAARKLNDMYGNLNLEIPGATTEQFEVLKDSVNPVRLKNFPIALDAKTIDDLYHEILREKKRESK